MATSKPWTKSYFIKRLRDSGYVVEDLYNRYSDTDCRVWSVVIDPGGASVIATCIENRYNYWEVKAQNNISKIIPLNDVNTKKVEKYIELDDGGQFIPPNLKIYTQSMDVILSTLYEHGINHKHKKYNKL